MAMEKGKATMKKHQRNNTEGDKKLTLKLNTAIERKI